MANPNGALNEQLSDKLCEAIAFGYSIGGACAEVGITERTFYKWYKRGQEDTVGRYCKFAHDVDIAKLKAKNKFENIVISNADVDSRDAKWFLSRRYQDEYGDKQKIEADVKSEVTVNLFDTIKKNRDDLDELED